MARKNHCALSRAVNMRKGNSGVCAQVFKHLTFPCAVKREAVDTASHIRYKDPLVLAIEFQPNGFVETSRQDLERWWRQ